MSGESTGDARARWTRAELLARAGAGGAGIALGSTALGGLVRVGAAAAAANPADIRHFHSRPDLRPPKVDVLHSAAPAGGHFFLAPSSGPGQRGVLILDERGNTVWFRPTTPATAMNFRAAVYKGEPVLTWWEGKAQRGLGVGTHVVVDSSYREIARLPAGHGRQSDLHEFQLTRRNTALVTSYEVTDVGGRRVIGGLVQELEIPSARVLFEWHSLDHVSLDESYAEANGGAYDYFHVNSIDVDGDGNLLVSARNTWAVYKVSRRTGKVLWRLGGKQSDFEMGPGTNFEWQHDARHHAGGGLVSVFDDGAAPPKEPQSRVLLIALDRANRRATLHRQFVHRPQKLLAKYMGNAQVLPNGDVVVGWGSEPYLTEFGPDGSIRFDAKLPHGGQNYRAFRFPWVGRPHEAPRLVAQRSGGATHLYASWNGATQAASWRLLAGADARSLTSSGTVAKRGFETELRAPPRASHVAVAALDSSGRELARSAALRL